MEPVLYAGKLLLEKTHQQTQWQEIQTQHYNLSRPEENVLTDRQYYNV